MAENDEKTIAHHPIKVRGHERHTVGADDVIDTTKPSPARVFYARAAAVFFFVRPFATVDAAIIRPSRFRLRE